MISVFKALKRRGDASAAGDELRARCAVHRHDRSRAQQSAHLNDISDALALYRNYTHGGGFAVYHTYGSLVGDDRRYRLGTRIARDRYHVKHITSGDTALRALRMSVADTLHIKQDSNGKRLALSAVIFALVAAILVWAKSSPAGFTILWRYFAWANQTLALFAFVCISVWMFENGKSKWVWMPLIPGAFYAFVTITYIMNASIGFNLPWTAAYIIGTVCAAAYLVGIIMYGKKRAAKVKLA